MNKNNEELLLAETSSFEFLKAKDLHKATTIVVDYEMSRVFPRDMMGIENINSYVDLLKTIFTSDIEILKGINHTCLEDLRVAAGMMLLCGKNIASKWLPYNIETGIHLDVDTASRMLIFHARHIADIQSYKSIGLKSIKILGCDDTMECDECKSIKGKIYSIENAPILPYAKCTCKMGCRCIALPVGL